MVFKLQYISDIHLEMHDKHDEGYIIPSMFLKPVAPYLALCGDIGIPELKGYDAFLAWCSKSWKKVFVIAGNHEFYTYRCTAKADIPTKLQLIQTIVSKYPNVYFLNKASHYIEEDNIRILGCTLWTDTSGGDTKAMLLYMNDTKQIYVSGSENLLPQDVTTMHIDHREWLQNQIQEAKERQESVVVLTHHLPSYQLIHEKYENHPLNMCFASNCEHLMMSPVEAWICGHSHTGLLKDIKGVACYLNPYGYPGERVETRNRTAVFSLGIKDENLDI